MKAHYKQKLKSEKYAIVTAIKHYKNFSRLTM